MERLPLYGIRILDLTTAWAGAYATRLLADMGAEVIKIEWADRADTLRVPAGVAATSEDAEKKLALFHRLHRNKYACTLDLSHPRGKELFLRLVTISEAVVDDHGAEGKSDLGLGYDVLRSAKRDIILVSLPDQGKTSIGYAGFLAGIAAAGALALALWQRRRSGQGQQVEVAWQETLFSVFGNYVVGQSMKGGQLPPLGHRHSMAPHGCYPCRGGRWLAIAVEDDQQFAALCRAMNRPELADDSRFADVVSRYSHRDELNATVAAWTQQRSPEEAAGALQAVGVAAAPVLSADDLAGDRHLGACGFWESVCHPEAGVADVDGVVWRMSSSPAHIRLPAPRLGEHNDYVLRHLLGLSEEQVGRLAAAGVIASQANPPLGQ